MAGRKSQTKAAKAKRRDKSRRQLPALTDDKDLDGLTMQERIFCIEMASTPNVLRAATLAGYESTQTGFNLMDRGAVQEKIQQLRNQRKEEWQTVGHEVLAELATIASANVDDFDVDEATGKLILPEGVPAALKRAVSSVKRKRVTMPNGVEYYTVEIKLWDKIRSLELIGRHLGLFMERKPAGEEHPENEKPHLIQVYLPDNGRTVKTA